jgi:hypothetical protein
MTAADAVTLAQEAITSTTHHAKEAIRTGKQPGMPLDQLANIARQAPLGSLLVAFLLSIAVSRRQY